jgi:hypothetical protein
MTEPLTSLPLNLPISQPQPLDLLLTCLLGNNRNLSLSFFQISLSAKLNVLTAFWAATGGAAIFLLSLPREPKHPRQPGMPCPPPERPRESPSTVLPNFHGECPSTHCLQGCLTCLLRSHGCSPLLVSSPFRSAIVATILLL